ncbi:MAG TPA: DciA family protein [Xanthobacteraceae bacterium]|jgi:hypothetical protein|nr:DciA family protein [Xanthobacteraceae bacterium]
MAEHPRPNKPGRLPGRPLGDLLGRCLGDVFARQGFASRDIVTHWAEIVGSDIATYCEPLKIQWPRNPDVDTAAPGTLVLRVEGPEAIEIQHLSGVILDRVNRFFGWQAVTRLALRQAPLARRTKLRTRPVLDEDAARQVAASLTDIQDPPLREALGRLGAAIKRT